MTNAAACVKVRKKDCVLPPGKRKRRDLCRQALADIKLPAHFLWAIRFFGGIKRTSEDFFGRTFYGGSEKGRLRGRE